MNADSIPERPFSRRESPSQNHRSLPAPPNHPLTHLPGAGPAGAGPVDEFDDVAAPAADLHAVDGVLRHTEAVGELALVEPGFLAELAEEFGHVAVGLSELGLGHGPSLACFAVDN